MDIWIPLLVALVPTIAGTVKYFIDRKDKKKADDDDIKKQLEETEKRLSDKMDEYLDLARSRYDDFFVNYAANEIGLCYTLMRRGLELDEENMINIRNLYRDYHNAGHNGHVEALYNKIEKLYEDQDKKRNSFIYKQ